MFRRGFLMFCGALAGVGAMLACGDAFAADDTSANDPAFKAIFDGKTLTGWDGDPKFWKVEDGAIVGQTTAENPTKGNTFLIWKQGEVDDFELRLKFKLVGGNSGIQYRSKDLGNWVVGGYQGDFEAGDKYSGINYEEKGRGILAERGQSVTIGKDGKKTQGEKLGDPAELGKVVKKEDWNDYKIVAAGNKLQHYINGQLMSEVIDDQEDKRKMSGILALQLHAGPSMKVEFKDILLKRNKLAAVQPWGDRKKIVMVAGKQSHGPGDHEFNAGSLLLKQCLDRAMPQIVTAVYKGGWPEDPTAYDNVDAVMVYADGGGGHPVIQRNRLAEIDQLMKKGVGLVLAHYAVEVPKEKGGPDFLNWIGGYFEMNWSVNPHWDAEILPLPKHPIANGVKPFKLNDEWYFHMRFVDTMKNVTPILSAIAPESTMKRPDGPHSGNPAVRDAVAKKEPQVVAWAYERPDGGRGFGYTGGHFHRNWADENNRKLFLNALVWATKLDVPADGVVTEVSEDELKANLDPKGKK
ncbi:MAG: DUF1080 domain-containing protein [Pirellulales bacterium]